MVELTSGEKAKRTRLSKSRQQRAIHTRHFRIGRLKAEVTKLRKLNRCPHCGKTIRVEIFKPRK